MAARVHQQVQQVGAAQGLRDPACIQATANQGLTLFEAARGEFDLGGDLQLLGGYGLDPLEQPSRLLVVPESQVDLGQAPGHVLPRRLVPWRRERRFQVFDGLVDSLQHGLGLSTQPQASPAQPAVVGALRQGDDRRPVSGAVGLRHRLVEVPVRAGQAGAQGNSRVRAPAQAVQRPRLVPRDRGVIGLGEVAATEGLDQIEGRGVVAGVAQSPGEVDGRGSACGQRRLHGAARRPRRFGPTPATQEGLGFEVQALGGRLEGVGAGRVLRAAGAVPPLQQHRRQAAVEVGREVGLLLDSGEPGLQGPSGALAIPQPPERGALEPQGAWVVGSCVQDPVSRCDQRLVAVVVGHRGELLRGGVRVRVGEGPESLVGVLGPPRGVQRPDAVALHGGALRVADGLEDLVVATLLLHRAQQLDLAPADTVVDRRLALVHPPQRDERLRAQRQAARQAGVELQGAAGVLEGPLVETGGRGQRGEGVAQRGLEAAPVLDGQLEHALEVLQRQIVQAQRGARGPSHPATRRMIRPPPEGLVGQLHHLLVGAGLQRPGDELGQAGELIVGGVPEHVAEHAAGARRLAPVEELVHAPAREEHHRFRGRPPLRGGSGAPLERRASDRAVGGVGRGRPSQQAAQQVLGGLPAAGPAQIVQQEHAVVEVGAAVQALGEGGDRLLPAPCGEQRAGEEDHRQWGIGGPGHGRPGVLGRGLVIAVLEQDLGQAEVRLAGEVGVGGRGQGLLDGPDRLGRLAPCCLRGAGEPGQRGILHAALARDVGEAGQPLVVHGPVRLAQEHGRGLPAGRLLEVSGQQGTGLVGFPARVQGAGVYGGQLGAVVLRQFCRGHGLRGDLDHLRGVLRLAQPVQQVSRHGRAGVDRGGHGVSRGPHGLLRRAGRELGPTEQLEDHRSVCVGFAQCPAGPTDDALVVPTPAADVRQGQQCRGCEGLVSAIEAARQVLLGPVVGAVVGGRGAAHPPPVGLGGPATLQHGGAVGLPAPVASVQGLAEQLARVVQVRLGQVRKGCNAEPTRLEVSAQRVEASQLTAQQLQHRLPAVGERGRDGAVGGGPCHGHCIADQPLGPGDAEQFPPEGECGVVAAGLAQQPQHVHVVQGPLGGLQPPLEERQRVLFLAGGEHGARLELETKAAVGLQGQGRVGAGARPVGVAVGQPLRGQGALQGGLESPPLALGLLEAGAEVGEGLVIPPDLGPRLTAQEEGGRRCRIALDQVVRQLLGHAPVPGAQGLERQLRDGPRLAGRGAHRLAHRLTRVGLPADAVQRAYAVAQSRQVFEGIRGRARRQRVGQLDGGPVGAVLDQQEQQVGGGQAG